jgi:DNA-binding NarL/FixJ family response regulator
MKNENPIRVVLADDHTMVREGLAQLLEDSEGIVIAGQAGDGEEAVNLAKASKPDVVVLDYTMPKLDGASATLQIRSTCPDTKVLILTVHENIHYAIKALEAGAHGFVLKAAAVEELVKGIRSVFSGRIYISNLISEKMAEHFRKGGKHRSGIEALSRREFELLRLLSSGMKLQDCAKTMKITDSTASTYRARLMEKLKLNSTVDLIRFALENGIIG